MEREFLAGVGFNLFVDQKAYDGWLLMLNGLMWAKEREYEGWRKLSSASSSVLQQPGSADNRASLAVARQQQHQHQQPPHQPATEYRSAQQYPHHHHQYQYYPRARSTSPTASYPFTFTLPPLQEPKSNPFVGVAAATSRPASVQQYHHHQHQQQQPPPIPLSTRPTGSKRSAIEAALSPEDVPNKRRPASTTVAAEVASHQHHHHHHHQHIPPPLVLSAPHYRIEKAEMMDEGSGSGSSFEAGDLSRGSSAEGVQDVSMDLQASHSSALAAGLGRMSLEPQAQAYYHQPPDVVIKQEPQEPTIVKQEEQEMHFGSSAEQPESRGALQLQLGAPYRPDESLAGRGVPKVSCCVPETYCVAPRS